MARPPAPEPTSVRDWPKRPRRPHWRRRRCRGRICSERPASQQPLRRLTSIIACAVVAALSAAVLAACGGEPDQSATEREVQEYLSGVVAPAEISDISCPENAPIQPGSTFLCDGLVEGSFYEAQVTVIDQQGRKEVRPRQAVMPVSATETELGAEAATALGFGVRADCGDDQYLVVSVGHTFLCKLERSDSGETADIEVEVLNESGAISWKLKG